MDIDSDTDGGAILELNEVKHPRVLHTATQTEWVGKSQFHKATQFPITHYSSDELRSMSADLVPVKKASLYSGETMQLHVSTQTEWLGHATMHRAIQFPEVTYCKGEDDKHKDLPPYVPAAAPASRPPPRPAAVEARPGGDVARTRRPGPAHHRYSSTRPPHQHDQPRSTQTRPAAAPGGGGAGRQGHHPQGQRGGQRQPDGGAGGTVGGDGAAPEPGRRGSVHAARAGRRVPAVRLTGPVRTGALQPGRLLPTAVRLPARHRPVRLRHDAAPSPGPDPARGRLPRGQVTRTIHTLC